MYCVNCGKRGDEGAKFCSECGTRLYSVEEIQRLAEEQRMRIPPYPLKKTAMEARWDALLEKIERETAAAPKKQNEKQEKTEETDSASDVMGEEPSEPNDVPPQPQTENADVIPAAEEGTPETFAPGTIAEETNAPEITVPEEQTESDAKESIEETLPETLPALENPQTAETDAAEEVSKAEPNPGETESETCEPDSVQREPESLFETNAPSPAASAQPEIQRKRAAFRAAGARTAARIEDGRRISAEKTRKVKRPTAHTEKGGLHVFVEQHLRSVVAVSATLIAVLALLWWGLFTDKGAYTFASVGIGSSRGYVLMAEECMQNGNYNRAVEYCRQALNYGVSYEAAGKLAAAYSYLHDLKNETGALLLCVDNFPERKAPYVELAALYPDEFTRPENVQKAIEEGIRRFGDLR